MAKEETIILIQRVLDGDPTITPQEKEQILKACRNRARRMVISAKEAMRSDASRVCSSGIADTDQCLCTESPFCAG